MRYSILVDKLLWDCGQDHAIDEGIFAKEKKENP